MAVDRGELRYRIAIDDSFTKPIQQFRAELLKAKNTLEFVKDSTAGFRTMQRDISATTTELRRFRSTSSAGNAEERAANRESSRRLREIANEQRKRNQVEKLRADILRQQRVEAEKAAAAERRAGREAELAQRRAAAATRSHAHAAAGLNKALIATEGHGNRVAFTFRRLIGILAAFALARQVVSGFTSLVSSSIQFNRTVEDSAVGLAALFVASGQVRDNFGNLVEGAEAFKIATVEAQKQAALLRQDALLTTATFEDLLVAFQAATGPGLAAGLNVDQIRQVAVSISQAATAFGLEQNQLAEEVRSLITGTGQLRTTRLAQLISNEDIRNARKAGKLFELLTSRLRPFGIAAEITQQKFSGLIARLQDAAGLAAGGAGLAFFTELKGLLGDLGDVFVEVERDAKGVIRSVKPDPQAVQALAVLFQGLKDAVATIREGIQQFDFTEVTNALAVIASVFRAIATIAVGVVRGLTSGLSDVAVIASKIFNAFDSKALQEAARLVTHIGTLLIAASLATGALVGTVKLLISPLVTVVNLVFKLGQYAIVAGQALAKVPLTVLVAAAALTLLVVGLKQVSSELLGVEVGFSDLPEIIGATIEQSTANFFGFIDVLTAQIKVRTLQALNSLVADAGIALDQLKSLFDLELGASEDLKRLAARERELEVARKQADVAARNKALELELTEAMQRREQINKDADQRAGERLQNLRNAIQTAQGDDNGVPVTLDTAPAEGALAKLLASVNAQVQGLISGDIVDERAVADKLAALGEQITAKLGEVTGKQQEAQLTAFDKMIQGLISKSESFLTVLQQAVQGFANFASSAIVDAFDPTKDVDLKERFARLLQDIAKQILQTLITLLIATAIAKAFGVPLPSNNETIPSLPTFAEGGPVAGSDAVTIPRPSYVPKSDTVPAWLTPGEFVQTVDAVRRYGSDVMEAIRAGAIDPLSLRALAGLDGRRSVRRAVARSGAMAFAEGGLVPTAGVQATRDTLAAAEAETAPPIALVVGNEQSLDRLLAGGRRSMLDFISANAGAINGRLAKERLN